MIWGGLIFKNQSKLLADTWGNCRKYVQSLRLAGQIDAGVIVGCHVG